MAKFFGPTNIASLPLPIPALKKITADTKLMTMHGLEVPAKLNEAGCWNSDRKNRHLDKTNDILDKVREVSFIGFIPS